MLGRMFKLARVRFLRVWECVLRQKHGRHLYLVERPISAAIEFTDLDGKLQRISDDKLIARVGAFCENCEAQQQKIGLFA